MTKAPRIKKAQGRSVKEWSSDDPNAMPPPSVRLRILRRFNNKCALTSIIIADGQTFDIDHIVRIEDGGKNCESNMQPVLKLPHEVKSAAERKNAAKADRIAKKAHGLEPAPVKKMESRGFEPSAKTPRITKTQLQPKELYR